MSPTLTAFQLARKFFSVTNTKFTEIDNIVLTSANNRVITFQTFLPGTIVANQLKYAVLEFTSGLLKGQRAIIQSNSATPMTVNTTMPVSGDYTVQPGDTCRIYGGPLMSGLCAVMLLESYNLEPQKAQNYVVIVGIGDGSQILQILNNGINNGQTSYHHTCNLGIMGLSPLITGTANNDVTYQAAVWDTYTLSDQIMFVLSEFRVNPNNNFIGGTEIEYEHFDAEGNPGSLPRRACMHKMGVESR